MVYRFTFYYIYTKQSVWLSFRTIKIMELKIHVIGNSHTHTFSEVKELSKYHSDTDIFVLHHLGAVTAKDFYRLHFENVVNNILPLISKEEWIILVVGEVDCRFHIPLQADRQKVSDEKMANRFCNEYVKVFDELRNLGYNKLVAFGAYTTPYGHNMNSISKPIYGDYWRRRKIASYFNTFLKENCGCLYFDIVSELENTGKDKVPDISYWIDYCHLDSPKVIGFVYDRLKKLDIHL